LTYIEQYLNLYYRRGTAGWLCHQRHSWIWQRR